MTNHQNTIKEAPKGNIVSRAINWFILGMLVVPQTQVKIFDLGYQLYTFELFHKKAINRWIHFIGIPLNLIALYCICLPSTTLSIVALSIVAGHHIIMALKYKFFQFIPALIIIHALFYILAIYIFEPIIFNSGTWYQSPIFHFVFWPFLQYATHGLETWLPKPWSLKGNWMKLQDYWKEAPLSKAIVMVSFMPFHTITELISSWRNLYLELLLLANYFGYTPKWFKITQKWINEEIYREDPIIDYTDYEKAFKPIIEKELTSLS